MKKKLRIVSVVYLQKSYTLNISYSWDYLITKQNRYPVTVKKKSCAPVCIFNQQFTQPKESVFYIT